MTSSFLVPDRISTVSPSSIALRSAGRTLTYGELHRQSGLLANHLRHLGATQASPVAICLERSFQSIIAALAAMRAGAAYVPIDPAWPDERIEYVVADCGASVFLAPRVLSDRISTAAIAFDPRETKIVESAKGTLPKPLTADDLAYIIYTSGSAGIPKGVEITHGNLDHLIAWHVEAFGVTADDHASHLAGLGFDAAVWEIWPYLAVGASLSLVDDMTRTDPARLQQWLVDNGITISFVPTPVAEPLLTMDWPANTQLRILLTGGDTLHTVPNKGLPFQLVNNYGPTECTVVATSGRIDPETSGLPSIGRAIQGATIYLLDERQQPVMAGERGEIYIGGSGVGRGYRNLPDLTTQMFLEDPFAAKAGARMYRTGDMASLLRDGRIAFHGRVDTQVKIRGNRIELDEIVSVLNRHPQIDFNVVVTSTDSAREKHLVAYVLPAEGASLNVQEIQNFAQQSLPSYMIPSVYVQITSLPLTSNGKVDRASLPTPSMENALRESTSREAGNEIETALLTMVRSVLGTDKVGVCDDFFLVGGHSLLGTQLVLRAREAFGVMLTLRDLFEAATVARLAVRIEALILEQISAMSEEEAHRLADSNL